MLVYYNLYYFSGIKTNEFDDKEMNLIPIWELIIERHIFNCINYSFDNDKIQRNNIYDSLIKSLLKFVPTISPFYYNSLKKNTDFSVDFLMESLKHSMNSIAVENPKLYLKWSSKYIDLENHNNSINEVLNNYINYLFSMDSQIYFMLFRKCCIHLNNHYSLHL